MKTPVLHRRALLAGAAMTFAPAGCAGVTPMLEEGDLGAWIGRQRSLSIALMLRNISPTAPMERDVETRWIAPERWAYVREEAAKPDGRIRLEGDRVIQRITPAPGSVTAAPRGAPDEPDYNFHWVRDSALVMRAAVAYARTEENPAARECGRKLADFVRFSRALQVSGAPTGLGETRFNLDGAQDFLQWNRPQLDGPALRALALMDYEEDARGEIRQELDAAVGEDLDYIAANWTREGYDLWEENSGHDLHARLVQIAALERGAARARARGEASRAQAYGENAARARATLERYWRADLGHHSFFGEREPQAKPGGGFDAAIVTGAVHARLAGGRGSLLDDRVMSDIARAEDLFIRLYPINRARAPDQGVLYGRYEGDVYQGGNAWVFITCEFAEAHYRIGDLLSSRARFEVTALNHALVERAARRAGAAVPDVGQAAWSDRETRAALIAGFIRRGDDILAALRRAIPETGDLPEQLDKDTGAPASARNLTWSHSSFLTASDARAAARRAHAVL